MKSQNLLLDFGLYSLIRLKMKQSESKKEGNFGQDLRM